MCCASLHESLLGGDMAISTELYISYFRSYIMSQKTNYFKKGYKLIVIIDLVILGLIIIGFFHYTSRSDTQQESLSIQTISQTLSSDNQSQTAIPWLGLYVTDVTTEAAIKAGLDKVQGAFIQSVIFGSPAYKAGLQSGDIIMSLNGKRIRTAKEFKNDIYGLDVDSEIKMCITREDYRTTINVVIEPAPDWYPRENKISPWLGVEVSEVISEKDEKNLEDLGKEGGVLVKKVFPGSPACKTGIEPDDILMSFNYRKLRTVREFITELNGAEAGDRIRICLMRGEIRKTLYPILERKPQNAPETFISEVYTQEQTDKEWGILVSPLSEALRERYSIPGGTNGVIILQVEKGGMAEKSGLLPGDLIINLNQQPICDIQTFFEAYKNLDQGALLGIYRDQSFNYIYIRSSLGTPSILVGENYDFMKVSKLSSSSVSEVLPQASRIVRKLEPVPHYEGYDTYERFIGIAFITKEVCPEKTYGYQSRISTLVGISTKGKIVGIKILEENESVKYTRGSLNQFIEQFVNKSVTDNFILGKDVDAVTGATITSSAINSSIKTGISIVLPTVMKIGVSTIKNQNEQTSWGNGLLKIDIWILFLIVGLAIFGYFTKSQITRYLSFGLSIAYIGFVKGGGISINNLVSISQGHFPTFQDNAYFYGLLVVAIIFTIFLGRFYCGWVCPFGFILELLHREYLNISVPKMIDQWLRLIKYVILIMILFLAYITGMSGNAMIVADRAEPFFTFFKLGSDWINWSLLILIIFCSIFISRAYCRYLCPLGAFLSLITIVSSAIKSFVFKIYHFEERYPPCKMGAIAYDSMFEKLKINNSECIICYVCVENNKIKYKFNKSEKNSIHLLTTRY